MRRTVAAPALSPMDRIAVIAPSTVIDKKLLNSGVQKLAAWGYAAQVDERVGSLWRSFAGTDETRADIVLRALRDTGARALWSARGGYGVTRILSLLDKHGAPRLLRRDPKPILGYSDATALLIYAYECAGVRGVHAPMLATPKWERLPAKSAKILRSLLDGSAELGRKSFTRAWPTRWLDGKKPKNAVSGVIIGGNLSLIATLAGTKWQPSLKGAILFVEDCAEAPYRLDRMMTQLWNSGMMKGVRAVMVGDVMTDVVLKPGEKKDAWKEVFRDRCMKMGIPVLVNLPVGHGKRNEPLPIGVRARIGRDGKLELIEGIVH